MYGQKEINFESLDKYLGRNVKDKMVTRDKTIQDLCKGEQGEPCFTYVYKVENSPGQIIIYGTGKDDIIYKAIINNLKEGSLYNLSEVKKPPFNKKYFGYWINYFEKSLSLISTPIKVRPSVGDIDTKSTSGLTNIGINLSILKIGKEKYYATGRKSHLGLTFGYMVAPSVEELLASEMESVVFSGDKSKQLFVSHGMTITFNYNNFFVSYIPIGFDNGTNTIGKNWVFEDRRWWGFGIGVKFQALKDIVSD